MQDNRRLLCSCFHVHARLVSSLAEAGNALNSFRCLKLCSSGTRRVYVIVEAAKRDHEALLELCRDSISLKFFFAKPDRREYTDNLLKFLSILAYLKAFYSVDFVEVYPYIVEALHNGWSFSVLDDQSIDDVLSQRIVALSGINVTLSRELVILSREKKMLNEKARTYRRFCAEVLENARSMTRTGDAGQHAALYSLGVGDAEISAVASLLAEKE